MDWVGKEQKNGGGDVRQEWKATDMGAPCHCTHYLPPTLRLVLFGAVVCKARRNPLPVSLVKSHEITGYFMVSWEPCKIYPQPIDGTRGLFSVHALPYSPHGAGKGLLVLFFPAFSTSSFRLFASTKYRQPMHTAVGPVRTRSSSDVFLPLLFILCRLSAAPLATIFYS